jgi:hypothetical protein
MPAQTITETYEELLGSPTETISEEGFTAQRTLKCAWSDRLTLAAKFKGGWFGSTYYVPQAYPDFGSARVIAVTVNPYDEKVLPAGGTDLTRASYTAAQLVVTYKTGTDSGNPADDGKPQVEESLEPFAEYLTLPAQGLFWGSTSGDPLKDDEAPGKLFRGVVWNYTVSGIVDIPDAVYDLTGKVNSSDEHSYSLNRTFAAETLLYTPPLLRRIVMPNGTLAWSIQMKFSYKPQGWNTFWRAKTQAWERIYNASGEAPPYDTGDFEALIF